MSWKYEPSLTAGSPRALHPFPPLRWTQPIRKFQLQFQVWTSISLSLPKCPTYVQAPTLQGRLHSISFPRDFWEARGNERRLG